MRLAAYILTRTQISVGLVRTTYSSNSKRRPYYNNIPAATRLLHAIL